MTFTSYCVCCVDDVYQIYSKTGVIVLTTITNYNTLRCIPHNRCAVPEKGERYGQLPSKNLSRSARYGFQYVLPYQSSKLWATSNISASVLCCLWVYLSVKLSSLCLQILPIGFKFPLAFLAALSMGWITIYHVS